jgi:hypothetical protein
MSSAFYCEAEWSIADGWQSKGIATCRPVMQGGRVAPGPRIVSWSVLISPIVRAVAEKSAEPVCGRCRWKRGFQSHLPKVLAISLDVIGYANLCKF